MKTDKFYIDQILDSISKVETFVEGFNFEKFSTDQKTQSAVILQLVLILGVRHLTQRVLVQYTRMQNTTEYRRLTDDER